MCKIIPYSLWGNNPRYYEPLLENLQRAKELFPEWIMHLYTSDSLDESICELLAGNGLNAIACGDFSHKQGVFFRPERTAEVFVHLYRELAGK